MSSIKLKMLTGLSGPKFSLSPGDEHTFSDYEAKRLVEAGFAELVETDEEREVRLAAEADAANQAAAARAEQLKAEEEARAKADAEADRQDVGGASVDEPNDDASAVPQFADLKAAREAYKIAFGKGPGIQWDIATIAAKIAAKPAEG